MSREIINVGASPNDGQGDPIRTAYIKTNNNFGELYARAQTSPPPTLLGLPGDQAGMYAYNSTDFYYCFQDYDGVSVIWSDLSTTGNVTVTSISLGTSNLAMTIPNGPITIGIGGISNVGVFSNTGLAINGNVTANYFIGNGSQLTGLSASYGNANVADYLPTYAGNLTAGNVSVTGNTVMGNLTINTSRIVDIGNNRISNVSDPVANSDVATKSYIDTALSSGITIEDSTANTTVLAGANTTLELLGTANEVTVEITNLNQVTFGLPDDVVVTGNVTAANLNSNGIVYSSGNIVTDGLFIGTFAGNITGNLVVPGVSTQVLYNSSGNAAADSGFTYSSGTVTVTGNVDAGNLSGTNIVGTLTTAAQTNITSVGTLGTLTVTGNVLAGNVNSNAVITASGNVTAGNLTTVGQVIATGNVSGNYFIGNGSQLTGIETPVKSIIANGNSNVSIATANDYVRVGVDNIANIAVFTQTGTYLKGLLDVTGNISAGNISVTGNVTGAYILGNGSQLSGLPATYGNANVANYLPTYTGNLTAGNVSITDVLTVTGNANVGNLGATNIVGTLTTAAQTNITSVGTLGALSVTGNVSAGNVSGTIGTFTDVAGTLTTATQNNITSVGSLSTLTVTGNASAGNLSVSTGTLSVGNIENTNANGVGNIGTATTYFNTVFAQATSAQYADLAEYYTTDRKYAPGTVVKFGGSAEVTVCDRDQDPEIAGVVSTNPAYIMNAGLQADHVTAVALTGRVPCLVQGPVRRGQMMVSAGNGRARAESQPKMGTVIGKALENFDGAQGTIEVVVGRL